MGRIVSVYQPHDGPIEVVEEYDTLDLMPVYTFEGGSIPTSYIRVPGKDTRTHLVDTREEFDQLVERLSVRSL